MARVLVIQQVAHEGLGTFEAHFTRAGAELAFVKAYDAKAKWPVVGDFDGLVVMGGPQGAYEQAKYPYLTKEVDLLRAAVKAGKPVLGVCLGSQLLAATLGGTVSKNHTKEIGWHPVMREPGADGDPLWDAFGQTETVFQWHGDTFTLPKGAVQLASAPLCDQQAFRFGRVAYGIQFHLEVTEAMIRAWMIANKAELAALKGVIDPAAIRAQIPQHLKRLELLSRRVAAAFCALLSAPSATATRPATRPAASQSAQSVRRPTRSTPTRSTARATRQRK